MSEEFVSSRDLTTRAALAFQSTFGYAPTRKGGAAGRVNLIGDHVDYAGGLVLPMAIDRWTVAVAGEAGKGTPTSSTSRMRLLAVDLDETAELDLSAGVDVAACRVLGAPVGHWSGYIAGVVNEMLLTAGRAGQALHPVDIAVTSSVPRASGLSSSAALEVAVAVLLRSVWEGAGPFFATNQELALACQRAEHAGGGVMCGVMDQMASVFGSERSALLIDCRDLRVEESPIAESLRVLVVDTRTPRRLSAGKYGELVARLERARAGLQVASLRDVDLARVKDAGLDADARASAEHFIEENARVRAAAPALSSGAASALARAFRDSHESLRDRLGVSCPELETVVAAARECGPEVAVRLTGAGMGGCAVVVCPAGEVDRVGNAVRAAFVGALGRECGLIPVRAAPSVLTGLLFSD